MLTTQILTEAEELCDDILIIHRGRLIARGSVAALKLLADRVYEVTVSFTRPPDDLHRIVGGYQTLDLLVEQNTVRLKLKEDEARVLELLSSLSRHGQVQRVEISSGSLEDVFVELTQNAEKAS